MNRSITDTIVNCALALGIAVIYAAMQNLDAITDRRAEWVQSTAAQDAIKTEAARARFERAAGQMCGNASYTEVDATTIRCTPRKGPATAGAVLQVAEAGQ